MGILSLYQGYRLIAAGMYFGDVSVVVKEAYRYTDVFFYSHLYHPEFIYEKRYNLRYLK